MADYSVPRIVFAAPQSSSGKTTVVTGILRALQQSGLKVQPFKIGPDYIDPSYHSVAAGRPGHNLDTWLVPKEKITELLIKTASDADIAVIEGVMGLYDGGKNGVSSTAEIAKCLEAPVILVINCRSMGESAAALALGFREYDPDINFAGVILNCLGSPTHEQMIREAMKCLGIRVFGSICRDESMKMPERHLGLTPAGEKDTTEKIKYIAEKIDAQVDLEQIIKTAGKAPALFLSESGNNKSIPKRVRIAVAHDEAFSFYYAAGLDVLKLYGAEIEFFSPLHDKKLPVCDAVILGGGFPELFVEQLSANILMLRELRRAASDDMPIYAECGGYMYLMKEIVDFDGNIWAMADIIPARAVMQRKLQTVGYVTAQAQRDNILMPAGSSLQGHEFHFSVQENTDEDFPWAFVFTKNRNNARYKSGYATENILASYLHMHFLGVPSAAERFIDMADRYRQNRIKTVSDK
ncbi:cobyrinate a,c-diamide synthase [Pectinatus haikarae]|uniref:Cobyrinate a,c-diamide synthase n=1 Tax=Pectinatus haikarae TaxID=349096 RepID=A0ABT9Y771_9FIRM|nr:cobyrinate a,c-diamide synthase [Pectinatus haikarae]MDQ0203674.1 cobyrinic acid a,c-diamide synthase [Pectinatus haikarae]